MRKPLVLACAMVLLPAAASARLAVSANDGKQLQPGEMTVTPDSVAVIDLGGAAPRVIGSIAAPAAMIGSPNAVVVSRDERFAIVTASQKVNPADPLHPLADDTVEVIDLTVPSQPGLLQTVSAGPGAGGVSINPVGDLVLVAARGDNAIYAFTLKDRRLTPAGRLELGPQTAPTDVVFAPDGRHAYAATWDAGKIIEIAVDGTRLSLTGQDVVTGRQAYGAVITRDGAWLINTNVGGTLEDPTGAVTMVDLKAHKLAAAITVGKTPEHVALSPDGRYLAAVVANGAAWNRLDPTYGKVWGVLKIFAVGPGTLTPVAQAESCHWLQGAAWRDDGKALLAQCAAEREIWIYRFDGKTLVRDTAATLRFESRPGSISTWKSR